VINIDKSIILLRDSTVDQNPELQKKDCIEYNKEKGWECIKIFSKNISAFKNEDVWKEDIEWAIGQGVKHAIVWNMDRYSREPEDVVLKRVDILAAIHNIQIHAVNGDAWSDLVENVQRIRDMGFMGEAIAEFLKTVLRGLEHQRAHRESATKSERVKLAIRHKNGRTVSYKGNRWGRKQLPKQTRDRIIQMHNEGLSMRKITLEIKTYDKNGNAKKISLGTVHKTIAQNRAEKGSS